MRWTAPVHSSGVVDHGEKRTPQSGQLSPLDKATQSDTQVELSVCVCVVCFKFGVYHKPHNSHGTPVSKRKVVMPCIHMSRGMTRTKTNPRYCVYRLQEVRSTSKLSFSVLPFPLMVWFSIGTCSAFTAQRPRHVYS